MNRLLRQCIPLLCGLFFGAAAVAQPVKVNVGYVTAGDWLPAMVAKDKGLFDKQGLDVTLTKVTMISNIPSAIVAGSLQIGGITPPALIETADAGLGLVALVGGTRLLKEPAVFSLVARPEAAIKSAKDLEGKRVGVPSRRSVGDVLLRKWMLDRGVNVAEVKIVETPFPQMRDLLKAGTLDAVAVLEPFRSTIVSDRTGVRVADFAAEVAPDLLASLWVAPGAWIKANPQAARGFRAAIAEAVSFIRENRAEAGQIEAKYLGYTSPLLLPFNVSLKTSELETFVTILREVGYLKKPVDVSALIQAEALTR